MRTFVDSSASKTEFLLDNATVLGLVDTPAIQAGQSTTVSINWDTRSVKGTHTIRGTADQTGLVGESNETNNSSTLTVTIQGNKVKNGSFEQPSFERFQSRSVVQFEHQRRHDFLE